MSSHSFVFEVEVDVDDWPDDDVARSNWPDRTAADYAYDALYTASLRQAERLDGYADLRAAAHVTGVTRL